MDAACASVLLVGDAHSDRNVYDGATELPPVPDVDAGVARGEYELLYVETNQGGFPRKSAQKKFSENLRNRKAPSAHQQRTVKYNGFSMYVPTEKHENLSSGKEDAAFVEKQMLLFCTQTFPGSQVVGYAAGRRTRVLLGNGSRCSGHPA